MATRRNVQREAPARYYSLVAYHQCVTDDRKQKQGDLARSRYRLREGEANCKIEEERAYIQDRKQRHARDHGLTVGAGAQIIEQTIKTNNDVQNWVQSSRIPPR